MKFPLGLPLVILCSALSLAEASDHLALSEVSYTSEGRICVSLDVDHISSKESTLLSLLPSMPEVLSRLT
jgi:hypothetical protein